MGKVAYKYKGTLSFDTNITLESGTVGIAAYAFYNLGGHFKQITIPNSIVNIGEKAFYESNGLTSIIIPDSVTNIGNDAFNGSTNLLNITIGSGVISIGINVFLNCHKVESVSIDNNNTAYDSRDNCNAIIETSTNTLLRGFKTSTIPNTVTSIANYAFSRVATGDIVIPNSVTSIGYGSFVGSSNLTSITIPGSIKSIPGSEYRSSISDHTKGPFENCNHLTTVILEEGVERIEDGYYYTLS